MKTNKLLSIQKLEKLKILHNPVESYECHENYVALKNLHVQSVNDDIESETLRNPIKYMNVQSMGHREESKMFKNNPKVEDVVKKSETEKTINLKLLKANSQQH